MRQAIETAPLDGALVILEDDASGTYDVARWSAEAARWVGKNGEPSEITPTHWHQRHGDYRYFLQEDGRQPWRRPRRFAAFPIVAVSLLVMGFMGLYFIDSLYFEAFHSKTILPIQDTHKADLALQQRVESDQARVKRVREGTQVKQAVEAPPREVRQPVMTGPFNEISLTNEFAENRHAIDRRDRQLQAEVANFAQSIEQDQQRITIIARKPTELTVSTEQHRQALEEERARNGAPGSEPAMGQRVIGTPAAQSLRSRDQTAQLKQAEAVLSPQSIEEARKNAAALALEAAAARQELAASAEQHRLALEEERARSAALASELATARREIETRAAQSQKALDEAVREKQAMESSIAELRQSLLHERDRTEAMARDRATAQRPIARRVAVGSSADSHVVQVTQAVKTAATEPPTAAETQGSAEGAKLIARASALLGQGNINAARIVLERAAESGNAQASFMLAETYDPAILSAWGTLGTRGEAGKAREYYAKAHTGGIREAKDRLDALQ